MRRGCQLLLPELTAIDSYSRFVLLKCGAPEGIRTLTF